MEPQFWHERWQQDQIGFHQGEINPYLKQYLPGLELAAGSRIFVPLCGKSRDLLWLAEQGLEVIGVELSPIAVEAFFRENGLDHERSQQGSLERWQGDRVTIFCGDYFQFGAGHLSGVAAVYDRASLIALPPAMRRDYVAHLRVLLPAATPGLLITMDYPADTMSGPPFAVSDGEVRSLYADGFDLELLEEVDALAANPQFLVRGLPALHERVYRFRRL
jgi:thiopurine S-methyltransferase